MGERHGCGVFDCPVDDCHETIIGTYGDLFAHVREEHPLARVMVNSEGESVLDRIKEAQKDALQKDIREKMVVDSDG